MITLSNIDNDKELFDEINRCIDDEIILPIEKSGTNGNRVYTIYNKYRVLDKKSLEDEKVKIKIKNLHPLLQNNNYLLNHIDKFIKYEGLFDKLNTYLFKEDECDEMSKKEKSFEIFGEEKILEDSSYVSILRTIGITSEKLNYYDTPEYCFNDYIPIKKTTLKLLICENKDIWFNIRRMMFEKQCNTIFGVSIDGVVYGQGNNITKKGALNQYTSFLGDCATEYLYWGDIDRAGFDIMYRLCAANKSVNIKPFCEGYIKMLELAADKKIPDSEDGREKNINYLELENDFEKNICEQIIYFLEDNKRLPQEIISYQVLLENMEKR